MLLLLLLLSTADGQAAHADKKIVQLSCYVAERMLQEVSMLDYLPSVVACCAIYVARKNMGRTCWSPTLEKYTKYRVEDLMPCLGEVGLTRLRCCQNAACCVLSLWLCILFGF